MEQHPNAPPIHETFESSAAYASNGNSALGLLLLIGLALWCWLGSGPFCFRWPLVVLIVLMTSGHATGEILSAYVGALAGPLLTFFIMGLGFWIMLRGLFGRPRSRYHRHERYRRRWDDRY